MKQTTMTKKMQNRPSRQVLAAIALVLTCSAAQAQDAASVDALRQTTRNLIDALVDSNVLTRDKADALLKAAEQRATATQAEPATTTPEGKPVLRVPYVPESVRARIRDEVKEEVITQARAERWGVPNAVPGWVDRLRIEGDLRIRHQSDSQSDNNTPAQTYLNAEVANSNGISRSPDFAAYRLTSTNSPLPTSDTQADRDRERLRLRLAFNMKVNDQVGVGIRLATGSASDRVSTNQTLGQNFNKYQLSVDRAFVRISPLAGLQSSLDLDVTLGRIPNPWFSTEMTWSDNLNFEGYAATLRYIDPSSANSIQPFATVGYFPIRESTPARPSRSLMGAQIGADWAINSLTRVKLGLAYYQYKNLEGKSDTDYAISGTSVITGQTYGQHEYPIGLRQRGNTVFETNPLLSGSLDTAPVWGLAYKFKPVVLTAAAEFSHFSPFNILVSGEYANNTAFSASDFQSRATDAAYAGVNPGGSNEGYQLKLAVGATEVVLPDQWQIQAMYRRIGSDALLDAFTDSDLGLGGTNLRGYSLGATYGIYRNTNVSMRYMAAENIDSTLNSNFPDANYKANSLQVDLNVRF